MNIQETDQTNQYLTFKLGVEDFAFDIANVREVLEFDAITKVPQTPEMMRGVINLRGSVVPVIDMRLKFGMSKTEKTVNARIVIVEIIIDEEATLMGVLADSVQEVMDLDPDQIEPPPKIGTKLNTELIRGMGKQGEQLIIILEISKLFSIGDIQVAQDAKETVQPEEVVEV